MSTRVDEHPGLARMCVIETLRAGPEVLERRKRVLAILTAAVDEGQMSRLLRRLEGAGLIENRGEGHVRGEPNAWRLTQRGGAIHAALAGTERVGDGRSAQAASLTGSNASTSASTS